MGCGCKYHDSRESKQMKRHVVYYLYDGSDTPRRLLARRGETPDACIETALDRLEKMPIDLSRTTVMVVSVGADAGYGGPIDVDMSVVILRPRNWELERAINV